MTTSSVSRGLRGGGVTIVGQLCKALVQMLSVIVLSRLLGPEDFGLIAMVAVAVSLGELVLDFGLTASALRASHLSRAQASNLFWINSAMGCALALILICCAPLIAAVYGDPRLEVISRVVAFSLLFNGLQAQLQVQLARAQRYVAITLSDLGSQVLALGVAIVCALSGWGYWALAAQVVVTALSLFVLRALMAKWIPALPKQRVGSKELVTAGMHYAAAQLMTFGASNVDTFVIGARWGASTLGFYNRAFQLLTLPLSRLLTPLTNVAVPTLAGAKARGSDLGDLFAKVQMLISLPVAVVFAVAAGAAEVLVPLVLGQEWAPAAPLFQILAIGGVLRSLSHVTYWMFLVLAPSREFLRSSIVTKGIIILGVVAASMVSVEAVAWAYVLTLFLNWPINLYWLHRTGGLRWGRLVREGFFIIGVSVPVGLATYAASYIAIEGSLLLACVQVGTGLLAAVAVLSASRHGRQSLSLLIGVVRRNLVKR